MSENAKLMVAQHVLSDALNIVDRKIGNEKRKREENPADMIWKILGTVLKVVAILAAVLAVVEFFRNRQEEKQAAADQEQKDLIRRMSAVKGRV